MEKKKIDDLFKEGLAHPEASFDELHWETMEQKLDRGRRKRIIGLIGYVSFSAAAAIVLLFLLFKLPVRTDTSAVRITSKAQHPKMNVAPKAKKAGDSLRHENAMPEKQYLVEKGQKPIQAKRSLLNNIGGMLYRDTVLMIPAAHYLTLTHRVLPLKSVHKEIPRYVVSDLGMDKQHRKDRRGGSLTLLAAPDITAVQGAGNPSFSQNVGLLYTHPLRKGFSVSAGIMYARKNYNAPYSFYRPNVRLEWSERPAAVAAACDVLDVPLLINYGVYNKAQLRVQVSAGISSYFMLREHYQFSYNPGSENNSNLPTSYEVRGKNNHLFGVADFSISVDKKINDNMRIGIRPFIKVPLTGIGYGQTRLESKGLALTLDFKLGKK